MPEKSRLVINDLLEKHGPDEGLDVASVEFVDPNDPSADICVGFKYLGGLMRDPSNWQYDHANRWPEGSGDGDEEPLSQLEIQQILDGLNSSVSELLSMYCKEIEI